ncbi:hypothetical protein [Guyparkeria sp. TX1]|uniref:hypothetical protein n=1 Tax=Guyparkeria sp. TX1 TaxID=3115001 RepID=UPI00397735EB
MKRLAFFCVVMMFSVGCDQTSATDQFEGPIASREDVLGPGITELWCNYLADPLWSERDAYDAAHMLMIPLEYSYAFDNPTLKGCFADYVDRLEKAVKADKVDLGRLNWLQHLHLVARYLVLEDDVDAAGWVLDEFNRYWSAEPAWLWGREPFAGISERIEWKLATTNDVLERSYYNVIFDEDYFAMTLGLDLYGLFSRAGKLGECGLGCAQAKEFFLRVFTERVEWQGDGWLIDVGRWDDHRDFAYSRYYRQPVSMDGEPLPPQPLEDAVIDSSHAHRYPSWLRSAELSIGKETGLILRLQDGLVHQFLSEVLAPNQGTIPLLNNYMDGHNGWFRWKYASHKGVLQGYGPYGLSGTFAFGWWALLGDERVSYQYERLIDSFPLSSSELSVYSDTSTRRRHPLVETRWSNGMMESLAQMSARISEKF